MALEGVSFRRTRDFGAPEAKNRPFLAPGAEARKPSQGGEGRRLSAQRALQARRYSSKSVLKLKHTRHYTALVNLRRGASKYTELHGAVL